jgi:ABC-2 type transport system permease protein
MFRSVFALIVKEFRQVLRDRNMLRLILFIPLIQLLILGYAVNTDVKKISTAVYDFDRSHLSRELTRAFTAGNYFVVDKEGKPLFNLDDGFRQADYEVALVIPTDFSRKIEDGKAVDAGIIVDGSNANSASIALGYAGAITAQYNRKFTGFSPPVSLRVKRLYNPDGESVNFMVPGIVAVLLTMITVMLTSMAIVREREAGTLEQLMVTPIPIPALIMGKTIPFAVLGFVEMSAALAFGILWFKIPFVGSWALLYGLSLLFLFTTLGVGMMISTFTKTQQQAMFFAWFFSIFAILTSGFFVPIENMPDIIQKITYLNPVRYYMVIVRGIMMKGSGVNVLYMQIVALVIFGLVVFAVSSLRFSKRVS